MSDQLQHGELKSFDNIDNMVDCYSFKFLDDNINGKVPDIYVSFYTSVKLKKLPRGFTRGN